MRSSIHSLSVIRLLLHVLRPHRLTIGLVLVLAAANCLLSLPIPLLVQRFVDRAGDHSSLSLPLHGSLILLAIVLQACCGLAAALTMGRVSIDVVGRLRRQIYEHLLRAEPTEAPGVILSRLTDDVACIQNLFSLQTIGVITDLGIAVVVAAWLLWLSPLQFLVAMVFIPLTLLYFSFYTQEIRVSALDIRHRLDRIFVQLKEKLDGALLVKGHGRENAEMEAFEAQMSSAHLPRVRFARLINGFSMGGQLIGGLGVMIVFLAGAAAVSGGQLSAGEMAAAAALTALLFTPLNRLADVASAYEQAVASGGRLATLMDLPKAAVAEPPHPLPLGKARGSIVFEDASFAYDQSGPAVLNKIQLHVEAGEHVAVIGHTGSGKSTLLNLILRFQDPVRGDISLDGIPLRQLALTDLRRQIGLVPQDPIMFRGSLADNIRYGCPSATMEQVEAAAQAVGVDLLALSLPQGYQTIVGEGGHPLSAGERQRVAIARALCIDPPIVLLDEATSNLDPVSEAEVQSALNRLLRGRTAIIVAHRLATVRNADRIVVLEAGTIVQMGSHAELIREPRGIYHRLMSRQHGTTTAA